MQLQMLLVAFATRACWVLIVELGSTQALGVTSEKMDSPQSVLMCVAICSKVQDLLLALVKLCKMPDGQFLQPVKGPLSSVLCADLWREHCPIAQVISEDIKQYRPQWGPPPKSWG